MFAFVLPIPTYLKNGLYIIGIDNYILNFLNAFKYKKTMTQYNQLWVITFNQLKFIWMTLKQITFPCQNMQHVHLE